jgi:uncharacterized protein (TIGR02246 family)
MSSKPILIALTSYAELGSTGRPTGFYVSEVAGPFQVFTEAGHRVDLVSVRGGEPPRIAEDLTDEVQARFLADPRIAAQLADTPRAEDVDPSEYAAILYAGGHGAMWDFPQSAALAALGREIYESGGVVGTVCHGSAVLTTLTLSDGRYLVDGREVAAFTNREERARNLADVVPFSLQDRLVERGAKHTAAADFEPWVVIADRLVTGQNPASAVGVAEAMIAEIAAVTPTETRRVTESYFDAENRRDLEGILEHFAEDVRFYAPDGKLLHGRAAIREFYAANAAGMPALRVELVSEVAQGSRAAVQWLAHGTATDGATVLMRGSNVVTVADGKFVEFHAYWGLRDPESPTA